MILRQRVVSYGISTIAIGTVVAAALLHPWNRPHVTTAGTRPAPQPLVVTPAGAQDQVDIVFVIDTTASMGALLEAAKKTVWSIATHVQSTDQKADLHVGLVAFRDTTDDYVTRPFALTSDLDAVASELYRYTPDGGGDVPENVAAGLDGALHMQWRPGAKKLIFVVGDAEPANRGDVPTYDVLAQQAKAAGIIVNTIRCGNDGPTMVAFREMASIAGGDFSSIDASAGVVQIATPYDAKMAELSTRIDGTTVVYGGEGVRRAYAEKMEAAAAAPAATKADRATYYTKGAHGGAPAKRAAEDLVDGYATGAVTLGSINQGDLPEDLRGKDPAALKAELDAKVAARKADEQAMQDLVKERDAYLAKQPKPADDGFDAHVKATLANQLK